MKAETIVQALITHRQIERERKEHRAVMVDLAVQLGADQERFAKGAQPNDFLDGYLVGLGQIQSWRKAG